MLAIEMRFLRTVGILVRPITLLALIICVAGCGTTKSYTATEHLLMSDAVDATVAQMDFQALAGKKVYLDVSFLTTPKGQQLIDSDYVTSSLRQQMTASGVRLVEGRTDADLIAEARLGALGFDGHSVSYGLPASNGLSNAASVVSGAPLLPTIPEISFARREVKQGAAKIAVFVFDRQSREPYWQSGIVKSNSSARDTWILGVGPLQNGSIYDGARFAGGKFRAGLGSRDSADDSLPDQRVAEYKGERMFANPPAEKLANGQTENVPTAKVTTAAASEPVPQPTSSENKAASKK